MLYELIRFDFEVANGVSYSAAVEVGRFLKQLQVRFRRQK
jgi:hypothetical protein